MNISVYGMRNYGINTRSIRDTTLEALPRDSANRRRRSYGPPTCCSPPPSLLGKTRWTMHPVWDPLEASAACLLRNGQSGTVAPLVSWRVRAAAAAFPTSKRASQARDRPSANGPTIAHTGPGVPTPPPVPSGDSSHPSSAHSGQPASSWITSNPHSGQTLRSVDIPVARSPVGISIHDRSRCSRRFHAEQLP